MKRLKTVVGVLVAALLVNSAYLWGRNDANVFYVANVLFHFGVGVIAVVFGTRWTFGRVVHGSWLERIVGGLLLLGSLTGLAVVVTSARRPFYGLLLAHIVLMTVGVLLLPFALPASNRRVAGAVVFGSLVLAGVFRALPDSPSRAITNSGAEHGSNRIVNPDVAPADMAGETKDGAKSPFFPSSVETSDGKFIPSKFFLESERCGDAGCHPDIVAQWRDSAHRFSSFNNQWYRRSITYMQEIQGIEGSKWCAGCHDPAVLLTGRWTKPIAEQLEAPESHAGLGCAACHSIVHVKNTMGNGGMVYEYPTMHRFAETDNPLLKALHDFVLRLDPVPHRVTFLKPFHTEQTSEFCSTCHKVHLDAPVNNFRWVRGFNEYDAWQISGVSGQGALSFYYPKEFKGCSDCHMPLVESQDAGNRGGKVHSHRFPGANTALPYAWNLPQQAKTTEDFLTNAIVTLDIFGMTVGSNAEGVTSGYPVSNEPASFTLSGDESMLVHGVSGGATVDVANLTAPFGVVSPTLRRGDSARISVVVRTRGIGHRFPGGTFDAFDVWVELEARDNRGKLVYHSGGLEPDGRVDRGAHFYRAVMVDANGNVINKRNAWAARTVLYARGIPPGAADTAHFRINIPEDCGNEVTLTARLHYRKFDWFNTHFAYAGVPADNAPYNVHYDDRKWQFTGDTSSVAGEIKEVPNLPIVTIAEDSKTIKILPKGTPPLKPETVASKDVRERWNDYGIGLLLQGDLKNARAIFERVTQMEPDYADGWVNVARAALREGDLDVAERNIRKAHKILDTTPKTNPSRAKAHFFAGQVHEKRGEYDDALKEYQIALDQFPRDRNLLNAMGRVYFLNRDFKNAVATLKRTIAIDPEDLAANYNLMLAYRGLGDSEKAAYHQRLYARFKADEASQAIGGDLRLRDPDLNLERQAIREHYNMVVSSRSPVGSGGTQRPVTARASR
jgi:tetratricopeptide (TPR) repeat protein